MATRRFASGKTSQRHLPSGRRAAQSYLIGSHASRDGKKHDIDVRITQRGLTRERGRATSRRRGSAKDRLEHRQQFPARLARITKSHSGSNFFPAAEYAACAARSRDCDAPRLRARSISICRIT